MVSGFLALGTFIIVTTFSPGPNNMMAMAAGLDRGLRKALPFLLGILGGFFLVMLASAILDHFLKEAIAGLATGLRWIGFAYLVYLASTFVIPHATKDGRSRPAPSFSPLSGLLLQLANPKVILYGISLWGLMPAAVSGSLPATLLASVLLSVPAALSILLWSGLGSVLMGFLEGPGHSGRRLAFNLAMALLLIGSAIVLLLEG